MKKVLIVLSEWGYWGEELVGPLEACDKAGYEVTFVTPTGKRPTALSVSSDPKFVDPPLGRSVVSEAMAKKARQLVESERLNFPRSLQEWFPLRAYPSSPTYLRDMEEYYRIVDGVVAKELVHLDAIVIVGGSGALVDLANNSRLHNLIMGFVKLNKPVAAVCYGVACLAFARDIREKQSLIRGKHVTGHPIDYDYTDGTGFQGQKQVEGVNFGPPFYPLEYILRDAVAPDGAFIGNVGHETSALVDYPFITARSTGDSIECGRLLVEVLERGLTRYGW